MNEEMVDCEENIVMGENLHRRQQALNHRASISIAEQQNIYNQASNPQNYLNSAYQPQGHQFLQSFNQNPYQTPQNAQFSLPRTYSSLNPTSNNLAVSNNHY